MREKVADDVFHLFVVTRLTSAIEERVRVLSSKRPSLAKGSMLMIPLYPPLRVVARNEDAGPHFSPRPTLIFFANDRSDAGARTVGLPYRRGESIKTPAACTVYIMDGSLKGEAMSAWAKLKSR